jgi:hypothetical protein
MIAIAQNIWLRISAAIASSLQFVNNIRGVKAKFGAEHKSPFAG